MPNGITGCKMGIIPRPKLGVCDLLYSPSKGNTGSLVFAVRNDAITSSFGGKAIVTTLARYDGCLVQTSSG
jgi:hypothetical protein